MKFTPDRIPEILPDCRLLYKNEFSCPELSGFSPFLPEHSGFLQVGCVSQYNKSSGGGVFALLQDEDPLIKGNDLLLLFPPVCTLADVFAEVQKLFAEMQKRENIIRDLETAVLFSSPRETIDHASLLLHTDLSLYNAMGDLVCSSLPKAAPRVSAEDLENASTIQINNTPVAYLFSAKPLDTDGEDFRHVLRCLESLLQRYTLEVPGQIFSTEILLNQLISGHEIGDQELHFRARLCGWQSDGRYYLMTAGRSSQSNPALIRFINQAEEIAGAAAYVSEEIVVFLIPDGPHLSYDTCSALESLFRENHMTGIVSRPFTGLRSVSSVYQRLKSVLLLPRHESSASVLNYDDVEGLYLLARSGYSSVSDLHPLCRNLLDMEKDSKFPCCETIYHYLLHAQNPSRTCEALHVHRNTLDYRIGRIAETCHLDFDNGALMAQLLFSLFAARQLGAF